MRLNIEDINAFKSPLIKWISQEYKVDVENIVIYIKDIVYLDAKIIYKGLTVKIDAKLNIYSRNGDLVLEVLEGNAKNKFLNFDLIDFIKPLFKQNSFFRIEENKLYFSFVELNLPISFRQIEILDEEIKIDF